MSDVFISYSRKNSPFARRLIDKLVLTGKDAWVDWEGIPLTSPNWWAEIKAGIEGAHNFVFIMSPDSMSSVVCNMELDYAIELGKRIVPVVYQDTKIHETFASIEDYTPDKAMEERLTGKDPLMIAKDNWQRLNHINWVFLRETDDFDAVFETFVRIVETDLEYVKAHTRHLSRAQEWRQENRRSDLLLFGQEIDRAETWLIQAGKYVTASNASKGQKVDVVNPLPLEIQREYIRVSRQAEQRRRRLARGAQTSIGLLILVLVVGGVASSAIVARTQQDVAEGEATLVAVGTEVQNARNFADSIQLAARAEDVFNRVDRALGLSIAYEASTIAPSPQSRRVLAELAYAPGARHRFEQNKGQIVTVSFSRDGKTILGASMFALFLWDVDTGEVIRSFEDSTGISGGILSPDAKFILSSNNDTLQLWDVTTGEILHYFVGHTDRISGMAFSPDGQTAVSSSIDHSLILWDIESGEILHRFLEHLGNMYSVAFSPDGKTIISGSHEVLLLWDVKTGAILRRFEGGHTSAVYSVAFSPDGQTIVSGSLDETIILWDVNSGEILQRFVGHNNEIRRVEFSPDGKTIAAAGGFVSGVVWWDVAAGNILQRFEEHTDFVESLAFSPDGKTIASASRDGTVILWDLYPGDILRRFEGHKWPIVSADFSPDGHTVVSASCAETTSNQCIRTQFILWDVATGSILRRFEGHTANVSNVDFSPDGSIIASASEDHSVILWNAATGDILRRFEEHSNPVDYVLFSPDGQHIVSASCTESNAESNCTQAGMLLWEVDTGEIISRFEEHTSYINSIVFSPDGNLLLSGSSDKTLILWDIESGAVIRRFEGHTNSVSSVAFSADGSSIVSGSHDNTIILWDVQSGDILRRFEGHSNWVMSVAFSADGSSIVSGSYDNTLILWDVESGDILRRYDGHSRELNSVAFSPDGASIISGAGDATLLLWRYDNIDQLQAWVRENRYVPELTCTQRAAYDAPLCESILTSE
ncbi:MAG: TIR domain-containing protein [Anaerolineae bacterium]|nr:TIR domain-containing protein [Anaerolineae bacterium]